MKTISVLCVVFCALLFSGVSKAQGGVYAVINGAGNVEVSWDAPCTTPGSAKKSWDYKVYKVKYKKAGTLFWSDAIYADTTNIGVIYPGSDFDAGVTYKVRVWYFGKGAECRGMARVRDLGETEFTYHHEDQVVVPPHGDLSEFVRIRSVSFNRCVYPYTPGSVADLRMHNWVCWPDPSMAFSVIEVASPDFIKLRSEATGLCLRPLNSINYEPITAGSCVATNTIFEIQTVGVDQFRLRNVSNNMCLYGSPDNGGYVRQFGCWNNPDMVFEFVEY